MQSKSGARGLVVRAPDDLEEMTPIRRAAKVVKALCDGYGLTTRDVATMTGLTMPGAHYMLGAICNVVEVYQDDDGLWWLL